MDFQCKVKQEEYEGYSISQPVIETLNQVKPDMQEKVRLEQIAFEESEATWAKAVRTERGRDKYKRYFLILGSEFGSKTRRKRRIDEPHSEGDGEETGSYKFRCNLCQKLLTGSMGTTSHFIRHLKSQHENDVDLNEFTGLRRSSVKMDPSRLDINESSSSFLESYLNTQNESDVEQFYHNTQNDSDVQQFCPLYDNSLQNDFNRAVTNLVIGTTMPLTLVDSYEFRHCFAILNDQIEVPTRKHLVRDIDKLYADNRASLAAKMKDVRHITSTVDVWSHLNKNFIGTSVNWIDPLTLELKHEVVGCRQINGPRTGSNVADTLIDEMNSMKVSKFVECCVTDGSALSQLDGSCSEDIEEGITVATLLGPCCQEQIVIECGAHKLNLIATVDTKDILQHDFPNSAFDKLKQLWVYQNSSRKASDEIKTRFNGLFLSGVDMSWLSKFNAVKDFLKKKRQHPQEFSKSHGTRQKNSTEFLNLSSDEEIFLIEYIKVMTPMAEAYNFLQHECNMYWGYHAVLIRKLLNDTDNVSELNICEPLKNAVVQGIKYRFYGYDSIDNLIATALHPTFKLPYVLKHFPYVDTKQIEERIIAELDALGPPTKVPKFKTETQPSAALSYFYGGEEIPSTSGESNRTLLAKYFIEPSKSLDLLMDPQYEKIKKLFVQHNSQLLSSAPFKSLSSMAKHVLMDSTYDSINDERFDKLVTLKFSKDD